MSGYYTNLIKEAKQNKEYRKVIYTVPDSQQLVLMSLSPRQEIGLEQHPGTTQFIHIVSGIGIAEMDNEFYAIGKGSTVIVPPGIEHNIINVSDTKDMKLYTIYSPPEH